jgi:cell division protein FtsI (penicillin-binding protein 3)
VYLSFLGLIVVCVMVLGKATYIQRAEGSYWRSMADSLHQQYEEIDAERGTIYSEDGSMLSTSVPRFDIHIDFAAEGLRDKGGKNFKENIDSLSWHLANLFKDQTAAKYKEQLQREYKNKSRFYLLKKRVHFRDYQQLRRFPLVRLGKNKSGFIVDVRDERINPFQLLANRTIGLARENAQNVGLERTYDTILKGTTGKRLVRIIAGGARIPVEGYEVEPENGKDIITTLDVNIQDIAESALLKMMRENEAEHGTCIVMEVKTGKIKAIANLGQHKGDYWENLNYALQKSEPGSTFKLATMIALIEDKYITINDIVNLNRGSWQFGARTMWDSEPHSRTDVTVKQAFELSSNVGMSRLVWNNYAKNPEQYVQHLRRLRFDTLTGIDLLGEGKPVIKSPKNTSWSATTLPWMSVGYEVAISPLQTLMLYNAVANNGVMVKPYLVNAVQQDGKAIQSFAPVVLNAKICSPNTLQQVRVMLEGVVSEGTAQKVFADAAYHAAGKTGTAQVAEGKAGYIDHKYQSSFAGYFPAENPQYSCIVVIKNKQYAKKYYGGAVAAPVFREVADKLYALYVEKKATPPAALRPDSSLYSYAGYTPEMKQMLRLLRTGYTDSSNRSNWGSVSSNRDYKPVLQPRETGADKLMPQLLGLGAKDAIYLIETRGAKAILRGRGKVAAQSVPAGTVLSKGQTIVIDLL